MFDDVREPLARAKALAERVRVEVEQLRRTRHTGWIDGIPGAHVDGVRRYYLLGFYCGWVGPNPKTEVGGWLANWVIELTDDPKHPFLWSNPYEGDSIGHLHPTPRAAMDAVEANLSKLF